MAKPMPKYNRAWQNRFQSVWSRLELKTSSSF